MAHLNIFPYQIPCTNRGRSYFAAGVRDGMFLSIKDDQGFYGMGEFAPLSSIHHHTLLDAMGAVNAVKKEEMKELISLDQNLPWADCDHYFKKFSYPASYLLSMVHLHNHMKSQPDKPQQRAIKLAALIEACSINDAVSVAQAYLAQGFTCLKIKVGERSLDEESKKITTIAALKSNAVSLRLDANRRLSVADAITLVKKLGQINVEYFEEPLKDIHQAKELYEETGINIAIDESFIAPFDLDYLTALRIGFVVIKPSRFATVYQALDLARKASCQNIVPIFSHCFESEFSAALFALMMEGLGLDETAHGILAEGFFKSGVLSEPLRAFRGQLLLKSCEKIVKKTHQFGGP